MLSNQFQFPFDFRNKKDQEKQGKEKSSKEGSTRLPKFPVVDFNAGRENATKKFPYNEVKKFRYGANIIVTTTGHF